MLHNRRLLCSYGRRSAPFGVRACLSTDGGRTWKLDEEIVTRLELSHDRVRARGSRHSMRSASTGSSEAPRIP